MVLELYDFYNLCILYILLMHVQTLSLRSCFFEFHVNSMTAVMTANVNPTQSTTKMPPTLAMPSELALDSCFFSSLLQVPVFFHHLLYNIWIRPFSCRFRMAMEIGSLYGEPAVEASCTDPYKHTNSINIIISSSSISSSSSSSTQQPGHTLDR